MQNNTFSSLPHVLVVDDEPLIVEILQRALTPFSEVLVAENGKQALDRACEHPQPDLILLDIGLPDTDGHVLCQQLKNDALTEDIPVIFTTARDLTEDETAGFEVGAVDYITKPLNIPITVARIKAHLERRRLMLEAQLHSERLDVLVKERTQALEEEMKYRQSVEKKFLYQACHDAITGLPNLSLLRRCVTEHFQDGSEPVALCLIIINGFQEINNTLGHQHGNELLPHIAERIHSHIKSRGRVFAIESDEESYYLSRLEGVSFGFILKAPKNTQEACTITEEIIHSLDEPIEYQGMSLSFSGIGGVAFKNDDSIDFDTLLRHAHVAHEQASSKGERVAPYEEHMDPYSERRLSLMGELRNAIQNNDLQLYFQPQKDLTTDRVLCAEALLRWEHPSLGFVPPDEFIPLAEQTGVIKPLTAWVLNEALDQCVAFEESGKALNISINISARNLREPNIVENIIEAINAHHLGPERLTLEITETAVMEDPQSAISALKRLNEAGISVALDDFGTGYSSLGYLRNLPVKEVKIDRAFVKEMLHNHADQVLVKTVIDMTKNLHLRVVAEGVEDEETLTALQNLGCDTAQGYHICRPIAASAFIDWLS